MINMKKNGKYRITCNYVTKRLKNIDAYTSGFVKCYITYRCYLKATATKFPKQVSVVDKKSTVHFSTIDMKLGISHAWRSPSSLSFTEETALSPSLWRRK